MKAGKGGARGGSGVDCSQTALALHQTAGRLHSPAPDCRQLHEPGLESLASDELALLSAEGGAAAAAAGRPRCQRGATWFTVSISKGRIWKGV